MTAAGFPHSGISGSLPTCGSPKLFAAYRALPRLSVPRHPPCALFRLTGFARTPTNPRVNPQVHARGTPAHRQRCSFSAFATPYFPSPGLSINSSFGGGAIPCTLDSREPFCPEGPTRRSLKGGDPAAGSPTATLLRLRPSHRARLRPLSPRRVESRTSGAPDSHGVTGGVYKARERIHRGVADPRLLAIPASCSRVTDCNPNLDQVSPIRSTSRSCNGLSWPL